MDELYGNPTKPKEKRVDKHNFVRQGMLEEFPLLNQIAIAIFTGATSVVLNGEEVPTQRMAGGTIVGLDYKGIRYVEQNPTKGSSYALRARDGAKIIWVMQNPGGYIGRIDNSVVWKDPRHVKPNTAEPVPGKTTVINMKDAPIGWKQDPRFVYIGRRHYAEQLPCSKWCNPLQLRTREPQEREDNLRQFRENFEISTLRQRVGELKGKALVCYCAPKPCHGDILAAAANAI
jgi:hypothetical protein